MFMVAATVFAYVFITQSSDIKNNIRQKASLCDAGLNVDLYRCSFLLSQELLRGLKYIDEIRK